MRLIKLNKKYSLLRFIISFAVFLAIMIFAPRHDGPHYIGGRKFSTKAGGDPLELWAIALLFIAPVVTFFICTFIFKRLESNNQSKD